MEQNLADLPLNEKGEPVDWAHALAIIKQLTTERDEARSMADQANSLVDSLREERSDLARAEELLRKALMAFAFDYDGTLWNHKMAIEDFLTERQPVSAKDGDA